MKKMLLFALLTIVFLFAGCKYGLSQPPKHVRQAFETMFPGSIHVEWEKVLSIYTVDFFHDGHEKEARFDKDGKWMRTKTELAVAEVPEPVMKAVREYSDWKIDDIYLYDQACGVATYYMIEFDHDISPREKQLHILPNGTIISAF